MRYILENNEIKAEIESLGAEIKSVVKGGTEYMWNADPKYWDRTSPILFPFVGSVRGGKYSADGREYEMCQHGFARDMEFALESKSDNRLVFSLSSNEETRKNYPYDFTLKIIYTLEKNILTVGWRVENPSDDVMNFSIGAHPAFMCPIDGGKQSDYKLKFDTERDLEYYLPNDGLLDTSKTYTWKNENGYVDITEDMFDLDSPVFEGRQASAVSLCRPDGKPYVTVKFDMPLFAIWSPVHKNAPFICIEPWCGRCDAVGFEGSISEREYNNVLAPGKTFETEYTIEFE